MNELYQKADDFFSDFREGRKMVLSSSENGKFSSPMMSVVQIAAKYTFGLTGQWKSIVK